MSLSGKNTARAERLLVWCAVLLYIAVWLRTAWVCDDAYITMRTVDNFFHGLGLRWNPAERVQSFTHPLWFFCLCAGYALVRNAYWVMLGLSFACSMGAVLLLAFRIARTPAAAVLAVTALALSKAFTDYSSSGLENPLTHLLLAIFWCIYLGRPPSARNLFALSLIAALAMLNRMDTILFYAPALAVRLFTLRTRRAFVYACLGGVPFVLWELFSLFYYGFPFPNTAYAKLNTGIPAAELLYQGCCYWLYAFDDDPLTPVLVLAGIAAALVLRRGRLAVIAAGMLLYLLYTLKIGGDFMAGRFFAAPLLCSVVIIGRIPARFKDGFWFPALGALVLLCFMAPDPALLNNAKYGSGTSQTSKISPSGIADERAYYYARTGLLRLRRNERWPYVTSSRLNPKRDRSGIVVENNTGFLGFYGARQTLHVLDDYALCDPLMSRLPVRDKWRIGHFRRRIPAGYAATVGTGENKLANPDLHAYYDALCVLTKAPLLSMERLGTIIRMNLGGYDDFLEAYIETLPPYNPARNIGAQ